LAWHVALPRLPPPVAGHMFGNTLGFLRWRSKTLSAHVFLFLRANKGCSLDYHSTPDSGYVPPHTGTLGKSHGKPVVGRGCDIAQTLNLVGFYTLLPMGRFIGKEAYGKYRIDAEEKVSTQRIQYSTTSLSKYGVSGRQPWANYLRTIQPRTLLYQLNKTRLPHSVEFVKCLSKHFVSLVTMQV